MKFHQTKDYLFSVIYIQLECVAGFFKSNPDYRQVIRANLDALDFESHIWIKNQELKTENEADKSDSDIQELFD